MSIVGSIIGGILGAAGDFASSALSAQQSYKYQLALLKRQQDFTREMSNTAHQREVADLRKAGLNPILTASGGQGASSPVVSAPSFNNTPMDLAGSFSEGVSSGAELAKLDSAVKNTKAATQLDKEKVNTEKTAQDLNKALAKQASAQAKEINAGLPLNRIPGSALNQAKSIPKSVSEHWGLAKDLFDFSRTKLNEFSLEKKANNQGIYRDESGRLHRKQYNFTVTPISDEVRHSAKTN